MNLKTFAAKLLGVATPNTQRAPAAYPRHEPPNFSATAKATDIASAIRTAENGDPQNLFRAYRDALLGDDHIQGCVNTRKLAVLAQPLSIMPKDRDNEDDQAAADACKKAVEDCENWNDGLSTLLDSHALWPVSSVEKIFRPADLPVDDEPALLFTLRRLEPVDKFLFCWKWAYQSGTKLDLEQWEPLLKLWPIEPDGKIGRDYTRAEFLDASRHIVHRGHLLIGTKDNWGGPGRAVLGWWLLRQLGRDWFGRFMERYAMPFPKGKTNSQDPQAVAFLQEAFAMATKVGGIVIDREDEVELVQAAMQGGAEGHKLWHDVCNNAISRAITGVEAGANPSGLNAGQSHKAENVREDVRMFDQQRLAETLVKQLFQPFLKINGLPGRIVVTFGGLSDADAKVFAETLDTLGRAGLEIDDESLPTANERLGFTVRRKVVAQASLPAGSLGIPAQRPSATPDNTRPPEPDPEDVATLSARNAAGQLVWFSAGSGTPRASHPGERAALTRKDALAQAYRGSMAPFRTVIENSTSKEECLAQLKVLYSDWTPERLATELEIALQMAAATGAAHATK